MANPLQWQRIKAAKERGAKIVVLDPLRTQAAAIATRWLRPKPGTDAAIGLAMMHVLIAENRYDRDFVERWCAGFPQLADRVAQWTPARAAQVSSVPEDEIRAAALDYADGPACFVSGHGIDAMSNGVQTFRAFHCLVAISGNLDRPGGNRKAKRPKGFRTGFEVLHDKNFRLEEDIEKQTIGAERFPLWSGPEGWQTACHNPSVIDAMLTGKPYAVRALYVSGVNIAVTYPDTPRTLQALRSLDFLAVATHNMTPTAALADIVLPKTVTLEEEEVTLHAAGPCLTYTAPVSARRGEARPDIEIAAALLERMEHRPLLPWRTQREYNEFALSDTGITIADVAEKGYLEFPWKWEDFGSRKIELHSGRMAKHGLDPLPEWTAPASTVHDIIFPLKLQTGLRERTYHHSRFREQPWAKKVSPDPLLSIHPHTAKQLGVRDGDWVSVRTRGHEGSCRLKAKLSDSTAPDTVVTGMGWWRPDGPGPEFGALDVNVNAALSYAGPYDPASGSADTRGIPCRIEPI
jgi:anaerobic selenocysteine-containing dehydrogenase